MGLSARTIFIDNNDQMFLVRNTTLRKMLRDPKEYPLTRFAGQCIRAAEAVVELQARRPVKVIQISYWLYSFNSGGVFNADLLERQIVATVSSEFMISPREETPPNLVDASNQFTARGARWKPDVGLKLAICDVLMGKTRIPRL